MQSVKTRRLVTLAPCDIAHGDAAAADDIDLAVIGREADAVGRLARLERHHHVHPAAGIDAIDIHRQLLMHAAGLLDADAGIADARIAQAAAIHRPVAVIGMAFGQVAAELRIGEPDAAILVRRQVVGRIERLAVDSCRPARSSSHRASQRTTRRKKSWVESWRPWIVEAVAVGGEGGPAEDRDLAGLPDIAIERVVLDVAEDGVLA